jgi:hypothetical protein
MNKLALIAKVFELDGISHDLHPANPASLA